LIGWLTLGLVVGFAAGFGTAWSVLRRRPIQGTELATPSMAPEPALAEPIADGAHGPSELTDERTDEEIHHALDATKGLLDELEGRYRGRTAPDEDQGQRPRRRPRRPRA
jgi:hypothetical protein